MSEELTIQQKLIHAFRIDRSLRLVWRASPLWTAINLILVFIKGLLPLALLYIMKLIIDELSHATQLPDPLSVLNDIIVLIVLAGAASLLSAALSQLSEYAAETQSIIVRDYVFSIIQRKSIEVDLAFYENPDFFNTLHRAQQEGPYRPHKIVNGLIQIFQNGISLLAMIGLLFMFHWSIGLLLIVAALPGVVVRLIFTKKYYHWQKSHTANERKTDYLNWVMTTGNCAKEIRLFDIGDYFFQSFHDLRAMIRGEQLSLIRQRSYTELGGRVFAVAILMVCFAVIAYRTLSGTITLGDMVMYFQAFQRGLTNLQGLLSNVASLYEDNLFVSHFFKFLGIKNTIKDPKSPLTLPCEQKAEIAIENVSFSYPGMREAVLKDVSMTIGKGEVVALVGCNGAGKSTLVKLLCRLYKPAKGRIFFNKINYCDCTQKDLRSHISTVFQDFVKYQLSARDNIRLGKAKLDPMSEEITTAAIKTGAAALIDSLPNGYDTILGRSFAKGEELSLGEWQKIALSRAFIRNSQFIILDEPASSLDPQAEYQMFSQFKELIEDRSALLISHRLSAVKMADKIFVLSGGTISESGSHDELIALQGEYAEMFQKQASWYTDAPP